MWGATLAQDVDQHATKGAVPGRVAELECDLGTFAEPIEERTERRPRVVAMQQRGGQRIVEVAPRRQGADGRTAVARHGSDREHAREHVVDVDREDGDRSATVHRECFDRRHEEPRLVKGIGLDRVGGEGSPIGIDTGDLTNVEHLDVDD